MTAHWRLEAGVEYAMILALFSDGKTMYTIGLRNHADYLERNRPVFERALSTFRLAAAK